MTQHSIDILQLDGSQFRNLKKQWNSLVAQSDADPLFSGWEWNMAWWEIWQPRLNAELCLFIAVEKPTERLLAILPGYKSAKGNIKELQLLGNHVGSDDSIRSNYAAIICHPTLKSGELANLIKTGMKRSNTKRIKCRDTTAKFRNRLKESKVPFLSTSQELDYLIDCQNEFDDYRNSLGKNTRSQTFNQRNRVKDYQCKVSPIDDIEKFLYSLNELYQKRWKTNCYSQYSIDFFSKAQKLGLQFIGIEMFTGKQKIATLICCQAMNTLYYLQLGFDDSYKRFRPGYLCIGEMIEFGFKNKTIKAIDLLPGKGKKFNYKQKFNANSNIKTTNCLIYMNKPYFYLCKTKEIISSWIKKNKHTH